MSWVRVDDHFPEHPKLLALGPLAPLAAWLWLSGLCYANRHLTDGFVPQSFVEAQASYTGADPLVLAEGLCNALLWHRVLANSSQSLANESGFTIHDYAEYQPSKAQVMKHRKKNALRQQLFRKRNAVMARNGQDNGRSHTKRNALVTGAPSQPQLDQKLPDRLISPPTQPARLRPPSQPESLGSILGKKPSEPAPF